MKRGQATIFIIIGVVLIALILIFIFLKGWEDTSDINKKIKIDLNIQPIYSHVENCIKKTGENAIIYIGTTGGYYNIPEKATNFSVAYYYLEEQNIMPTKEKVSQEISSYINENLKNCIDFQDFSEFTINTGEINTDTVIEANKTIFNVVFPLSIRRGEKTFELENFNDINVNVRLGVVYNMIFDFMKEQTNRRGSVCLNCLNVLAIKNNLKVEMSQLNNDIIFTIIDEKLLLKGQNYNFFFVNKYEMENAIF